MYLRKLLRGFMGTTSPKTSVPSKKIKKPMTKKKKNKICIYTAIYNDYEILRDPISVDPNVDYICFTDDKTLSSKVWKIKYMENVNNYPSSVFYKEIKCLPHKYLKEYDYTIWLDANFVIRYDRYINYLFSYFKDNKILLYNHFCLSGIKRNCIYEEARISRGISKYKNDNIDVQAETYFRVGYPRHNGLYQSGFLLRNNNDNDVKKFNECWW
jgi:hypothetical protein